MIVVVVWRGGGREAGGRVEGLLLSLTFVLGMVCLFTAMGGASSLLGKGFGSALGSAPVVAGIAVLFLLLSASLFGAFEIALPSSMNNRLAGVSGRGFAGAFLLGLVCGIVPAPCVGPFLSGVLGW